MPVTSGKQDGEIKGKVSVFHFQHFGVLESLQKSPRLEDDESGDVDI